MGTCIFFKTDTRISYKSFSFLGKLHAYRCEKWMMRGKRNVTRVFSKIARFSYGPAVLRKTQRASTMTRASCRKLNETEKRKHDPKENHDRLGGSENKF